MDKFAGTNIATSAGGEVLGSKDAAIESGNTLDFVMASRSVAGLVRLSVDKVVPFAPHFCLMLEIDLAHGLLNLPSLKGFAGLQGSLPAPSPSPVLTPDPGPEHRPAGWPSAGDRPGPFQDKSGYPPSLRHCLLSIACHHPIRDPLQQRQQSGYDGDIGLRLEPRAGLEVHGNNHQPPLHPRQLDGKEATPFNTERLDQARVGLPGCGNHKTPFPVIARRGTGPKGVKPFAEKGGLCPRLLLQA